MMLRLVLVPVLCATLALAQNYDNYYRTTERPRILHPPAKVHYASVGQKLSGDYKFGYDTGKGPAGQSFREETRLEDGTVKGSYGYLDDQGVQRVVKYTAGAQGFVLDSDTPAGPAPAAQPRPRSRPAYRAPEPAYREPEPAPLPQYREPPAQQYRAARTQEYRRPRTQEYRPPREEYKPAPQQYQPPAQTYNPPAQQTYSNPTRNPAYNPHHAAYYASLGQQYIPPRPKSEEERRREEENYGPPVIPYDLLSYNIGTAQG